MVSNANEDFPDPDTPVTTVRELCGISTSIFLRLWTRAPRTAMVSVDISQLSMAAFRSQSPVVSTWLGTQTARKGVGNLSIINHTPEAAPFTSWLASVLTLASEKR